MRTIFLSTKIVLRDSNFETEQMIIHKYKLNTSLYSRMFLMVHYTEY